MNLRAAAAETLYQVIVKGTSLSEALTETFTDPRDQAFLQAVCYGVCRRYFYLDAILQQLIDKPLKAKDQDVYLLLLVGLYQLSDMRVPEHAAIAETVAAVKKLKKIWAKGLVNAVLRNYQRRAAELQQQVKNNLSAYYSHPMWFIKKIQQDWPEDWASILDANNQQAPLSLRVNQRKITRENYLPKISGHVISETASGISLDKPVDVQHIPDFFAGEVSVQDGAAQMAAELLQLMPGQRVLDACAAPGGKTAHILELQPALAEVVAIDKDEKRLSSVAANLQRLHLSATLIVDDAGNPARWWDKKLFDRILLDAPCSASGVIRRHPDIKILRRENDIAKLAVEQLRLLTALWPLLNVNGLLVYATCSIFTEENEQVLQTFLAQHPEAKMDFIETKWGKKCDIGKQILPGMYDMDGFYYARLRKC